MNKVYTMEEIGEGKKLYTECELYGEYKLFDMSKSREEIEEETKRMALDALIECGALEIIVKTEKLFIVKTGGKMRPYYTGGFKIVLPKLEDRK